MIERGEVKADTPVADLIHKPVPTRDGKQITLDLRTGQREAAAAFYPLEPDQIDNAAPQAVTPTATGVRLVLQRADPAAAAPGTVKGVVQFDGGRAFEFAAPVRGKIGQ